ncbi:nitronate monooxygenase [Flavonifractor sp. An10]|uniref:nitronate monooxygenase n=1 Tax=Flavonifractor sp. An10 TaxID=1965537 RepID=UPI000B3AF08C|nr:nitronate monooxygenase [Flavonifractor sp. An10]OUQ83888.1 nitronate monooxygenase [Flavonifractor sp. An10]
MKLNELLGIEFPIIQGGMANIATGKFAAAVSNAGALGLVAGGGLDAEALRAEIRDAKAATDKPFGVNLMLMNPHIDELAKVVVEEGVQVVTTGAGNPGKYVPAWKEAGIKVFPVVAAPVLAKRLERYGIDGVIAEGTESGGHVGEMTTMALVPQVADAVSVPVIAAGGIADGRQLCAAFALGACGVQVGTVLLASEECPIHDNYKGAVLKAGANDTVVTGRSGGAPVRVLKNKMAREYLRMEKQNLPLEEMEKLTLGSLRRAVFDGDVDTGSFMAGQVAGMVHAIRPLRQIFEELMAGYEQVRKELSE